jgi:hypothetical protein
MTLETSNPAYVVFISYRRDDGARCRAGSQSRRSQHCELSTVRLWAILNRFF